MREVFSRIEDRNIPLHKRQLYKLYLEDSDPGCPGGFVVREARLRWDEQRNHGEWHDVQKFSFRDIEKARLRYSDLRLQLVLRRFHSISSALTDSLLSDS